MRYFEDYSIGEIEDLGSYTFVADDIKSFATRFDPQLFHVDEAAAAQSHFGALCASGWHTAAIWMRLLVARRRREAEAAGAPPVPVGPALGFREMRWLKPVFAGDTITYRSEVTAARGTARRPGHGLLTIRSTGLNQNGELVVSFVSTTLIERRPAGHERLP